MGKWGRRLVYNWGTEVISILVVNITKSRASNKFKHQNKIKANQTFWERTAILTANLRYSNSNKNQYQHQSSVKKVTKQTPSSGTVNKWGASIQTLTQTHCHCPWTDRRQSSDVTDLRACSPCTNPPLARCVTRTTHHIYTSPQPLLV